MNTNKTKSVWLMSVGELKKEFVESVERLAFMSVVSNSNSDVSCEWSALYDYTRFILKLIELKMDFHSFDDAANEYMNWINDENGFIQKCIEEEEVRSHYYEYEAA